MNDRILIRPGQLHFARGEYDRRRVAELKHERAQLRVYQLEASQRTLDRIDVELGALRRLRWRELAPKLAAAGFNVDDQPEPLAPHSLERDARRHRGRPNIDAMTRARQEEAFAHGRLVRTFTTTIRVR